MQIIAGVCESIPGCWRQCGAPESPEYMKASLGIQNIPEKKLDGKNSNWNSAQRSLKIVPDRGIDLPPQKER